MKKPLVSIFYFFLGLSFSSCYSWHTMEMEQDIDTYNRRWISKEIKEISSVKWTLVYIRVNEREELSEPFNGKNYPLRFNEDKSFSGYSDCNLFSGKYKIIENEIYFYDRFSTSRGCRDMEGYMEQLMITRIGEVNNYLIKGNLLILKNNDTILMKYKMVVE